MAFKKDNVKQIIDTSCVESLLPTKTHFYLEKDPYEVWDIDTIKDIPCEESERFNKLYLDNKFGFKECTNIMNSGAANSVKDKLISGSILKFCSKRNLTLIGAGRVWNKLSLTDPTSKGGTQFEEIRMTDLFHCLLYTYQYLNDPWIDNRVPCSWLENNIIVYIGVEEFLDRNDVDLRSTSFCALDTMDYYLSSINYLEHSYIRKSYLKEKKEIGNDSVHLLKRIGLLENRVGCYHFVSNKAKNFGINQFKATRRFSFPSLTPKKGLYVNCRDTNYIKSSSTVEEYGLLPSNPYNSHHSEYLVFCNGNDIALKHRTFFDYLNSKEGLVYETGFLKYQESLLLLYSYLDFICVRDLYKNRSIYYSHDQDWDFK